MKPTYINTSCPGFVYTPLCVTLALRCNKIIIGHSIVYIYTRISGAYGPLILALAEGWLASLAEGLASLARGLASLNLNCGSRP